MHIILGLLGAVVTILILTKRLGEAGITLDSINPFAWYRKHQWMKKYKARPLFGIDDPQKVAGLLVVAIAHVDGIISLEEKQSILKLFEDDFELTEKEASGLFTSSAYFLKDEEEVGQHMAQILKLTADKFTGHQIEFTMECMQKIAALHPDIRVSQKYIMGEFAAFFKRNNKHQSKNFS